MARTGGLWLLLGAALGTALVCRARPASAAPKLEYVVATGCPDRGWFEHELQRQELPSDIRGALRVNVTSRPPTVQETETEKAPRSRRQAREPVPQLEVLQEPPPLSAELEYTSPAQAHTGPSSPPPVVPWQRTLAGANCEELLSALAVSFVVYLESRDNPEPPSILQEEPLPPVIEPNFDPPKLDYVASATWRLGLIAGFGIQTGLAPSATGSWHVAIHLRGVRPGWGAGPFQLGFGAQLGSNREQISGDAGPANPLAGQSWEEQYWTVHLLACPWMTAPSEGLRFGPGLEVHGGRFGATLPAVQVPNDDDEVWFAFYELLLIGEIQSGGLLTRAQAGLQFPVNAYRVAFEDREVYHQQAGLVLGVALGWSGVLL